jgi:hypothetical protein
MLNAAALTGGFALLAANYARSLLAQAIRYILDGFQQLFDSAQQHNPLVDLILDGFKLAADIFTVFFAIKDTATLISKIRDGAGLLGKAAFLFREAISFFRGGGVVYQAHGSLIATLAVNFVVGTAAFLGGSVVPDIVKAKEDFASYQSY